MLRHRSPGSWRPRSSDHQRDQDAGLHPPDTYDADGTPVDSKLEITGRDELALTAEHQRCDLAYPLMIDPDVVTAYRCGLGWKRWSKASNCPGLGYAIDNATQAARLYLSVPTNTGSLRTALARFHIVPKGTNIYSAWLGNTAHHTASCDRILPPDHRVFCG